MTLGLVVVGIAVVIALGFLMGYMAAPTPYPAVAQTAPEGGTVIAVGHLANVIFVFGLLVVVVLGGAEISGKGLQLVRPKA